MTSTGKRAQRAGGARGGSASTPAKKKAARANGAKGGKPRDTLPAAALERLGAAPATPAAQRAWVTRFAIEIAIAEAGGLVGPDLAARLRVNVGAIQKTLPQRSDDDDDPGDDEEDVEPDGLPLERITPGKQLHVVAR